MSGFFSLRRAVDLYLAGGCLMLAMFVLNDMTHHRYEDLILNFFIYGHGVLGIFVVHRIRRKPNLVREWLDLIVLVVAFWVGPLAYLYETRKHRTGIPK